MPSLNFYQILKSKNVHRPLVFHSVLWTLAFLILIFVFSKGKQPVIIDLIYTIGFLLMIAVPVCINFYLLIPRFLRKEKYALYAISHTLTGVIFGYVIYKFFLHILDLLFPSYFFISYLTDNNLVIVIAIFLISATLLKLGEDWFYFNSNQNKILRNKSLLFETQLTALRSQINPHFLFNSLNVIYALALEKKEDISKAIVQLSDILRYVIYDSDSEKVSLKDEIILLKNYIEFQNYRVKTPNATELTIEIENEDFKIYPMLLLPLLENSYKHGIVSGETETPIKISLNQKNHNFIFAISNANISSKNTIEDKHSGVGLVNLKNNLNLVYPNHHKLIIEDQSDIFKVTLTLTDEI
ncbi:sensor histidine kinase [Winogradskyella alexanderae]|uniref:Histidine kinase n=1 Tax=Winogradskyella alexanderae TaxID=2877123 RepID=A0ABS7XSE5_9FLAO|nr:sensor histidine kinase [Winogradskyella alexanderae]MCA0131786.1 histidine kinase [Winogradskyella alexanderae]